MELKLTRPLVVIDLETTGVMVARDRIIEICMLKVKTDGTSEIITKRVNPTIPISAEATSVHGITNEDLKDEPVFAHIAKDVARFMANCDIAGYNSIRFDIPLLIEEFLRVGVDFDIKNRRFIDAQNIFHKMEPRTLKAAYKFYCNQDLENAHTAEADTIATYEVLKAQLDKYDGVEYEDKDGNISIPITNDMQALHDFSVSLRNADLVGHIVYNDKKVEVFNFGKHKGKAVEAVFEKEPSYFDWIMKSDFPLSTKKLIQTIKLRGFNKGAVNIG